MFALPWLALPESDFSATQKIDGKCDPGAPACPWRTKSGGLVTRGPRQPPSAAHLCANAPHFIAGYFRELCLISTEHSAGAHVASVHGRQPSRHASTGTWPQKPCPAPQPPWHWPPSPSPLAGATQLPREQILVLLSPAITQERLRKVQSTLHRCRWLGEQRDPWHLRLRVQRCFD